MLNNTPSLQYPILSGSVNQNNIYYAVNQLKNNATNYSYYFRPIPQWDTRLVTDISGLFEDYTTFNEPIGNWNVSNVSNMNALFLRRDFIQSRHPWMGCIYGHLDGVYVSKRVIIRSNDWQMDDHTSYVYDKYVQWCIVVSISHFITGMTFCY